MVLPSPFVIESTGAVGLAEWAKSWREIDFAWNFFQEKMMSSASSGRLLVGARGSHLALSRIVSTSFVGSTCSHLVAIPCSTSPVGTLSPRPGLYCNNRGYTQEPATAPVNDCAASGSRLATSA